MDDNIYKDKNGLNFLLDKNNFTASVTKSKNAENDIFIPFSIHFDDNEYIITSIGNSAFKMNRKIKSVSFPEVSALKTIETEAFNSSTIVSIKIPSSLTKIGERAFFYSNLESIEIPPDSNIEVIDNWAFKRTFIKKFVLPPKLKELKQEVFSCCELLQIIDHYPHCELQSIGEREFAYSGLEILKIPPLFDKLNDDWCICLEKLKKIIVSPKNQNFCFLDGNYFIGKSNKDSQIYDILYFVNREIEEAVIPASVKVIGKGAISHCQKIKSIKFNENSECTCFDEYSFLNSSFESIVIPPKVTVFKKGTFCNCVNLKSIEIPMNSELQKICKDAFNSTKISSLYFPSKLNELENSWCRETRELNEFEISPENKNFSFIDNNFLYGKTDKNSEVFDILYCARRDINYELICIPMCTKKIASYSFSNCYSIYSVTFYANSHLTLIDKYAFYESSIYNISLPPRLQIIGKKAFADNHTLHYVNIPNNSFLNVIEARAFENTNVTYFYFPSNLSQIKEEAFQISNIKMVDFSPSIQLKSIDMSVFNGTFIEKIKIPSSVSVIKPESFSHCERLKYIEFQSDSNLELIENAAFLESNLKSISIPSKTIKIDKFAFSDCIHFVAIEILGENHSIQISEKAFLNVSDNFSLFAHKTVAVNLID